MASIKAFLRDEEAYAWGKVKKCKASGQGAMFWLGRATAISDIAKCVRADAETHIN